MTKDASRLVAISSIMVNMMIFVVKAIIAINISSLSLLSDSIHTLTDSVSSMSVLLGLRLSEKPADETHPYGHGRAEYVAVLFVGLILILTAFTFIFDGILTLVDPPGQLEVRPTVFMVVAATAVLKLLLWAVSYRVGKSEGSPSLLADAWHHMTDVFTTVVVILALWGASMGYPYLDSLAGIFIALFILYIGFYYTRNSVDELLGTAPSQEMLEKIKEDAESFEGVKEVHGIKVHDYGGRAEIYLHMRPDDSTPSSKTHALAHELKEHLEKQHSATVEVHHDPWEPPSKDVLEIIQNVTDGLRDVKDIHRVQLLEKKDGFFVSMHLVLPKDTSVDKAHIIGTRVEKMIKDAIERKLCLEMDVQVHMEPCNEQCEYCGVEEHYLR